METTRHITLLEATAILISTIIGVGILALPLIAVRAADTGAPLLTLAGVIVGFIGLMTITMLGKRFPEKSIIQYSQQIIGKWPAIIANTSVILFFAFLTSLAAREKLLWPTLELAKTTSLPANILERLDAAFLAVWVTAVFTTLFISP